MYSETIYLPNYTLNQAFLPTCGTQRKGVRVSQHNPRHTKKSNAIKDRNTTLLSFHVKQDSVIRDDREALEHLDFRCESEVIN